MFASQFPLRCRSTEPEFWGNATWSFCRSARCNPATDPHSSRATAKYRDASCILIVQSQTHELSRHLQSRQKERTASHLSLQECSGRRALDFFSLSDVTRMRLQSRLPGLPSSARAWDNFWKRQVGTPCICQARVERGSSGRARAFSALRQSITEGPREVSGQSYSAIYHPSWKPRDDPDAHPATSRRCSRTPYRITLRRLFRSMATARR